MKVMTAIPVLLVVAVVGSAIARDNETDDIKEKMKINYEKMGEMLDNILLDDNWDVIAEDAGVLKQHAQVIKAIDPNRYTKGMPKSEYFQAYALHLESSSQNLKVVAEQIERERASGAEKSRHLRPNGAVFFGQAVSMCTNCHNQFRGK
jgi:cytochrome c556